MKTANIKKVIDRLLKSDERAILINGVWGIGKTYEIKEYIKEKKEDIKNKKIKIAYSSLFGKNSIDEVNTELYQIFHPCKKVLNVITNVAKIINVGVGLSCGINLNLDNDKIDFDKNLKSNKKKTSLIILDDFERKSEKITAEELLGFINGLINQGFKVVVLADLATEEGKKIKKYEIANIENNDEIIKQYISKINFSDDILGIYKEKVFDRIYNITETPESVIKSIFGKNVNYVDNKTFTEFDKNIRMAIKANFLFNQIYDYIEEKKYKCNKFEKIMKICVYAVNELMTGKYSKQYKEQSKKYKYMQYSNASFGNIITNADKSLRDDYSLIEAVNDIYRNENYSTLDMVFDPKIEDNILQSCFYFSDENKIKIIEKQYQLILSIPNDFAYDHSTINQFIRDWYCYAYYLDLSFIDKKVLFEKLRQLKFRIDSFGEKRESFINVIKEYNIYCNEKIKDDIINKLKSKDYNELLSYLYDLSQKYKNFDESIKSFIKEYLKNNRFLIVKLDGDISEEIWKIDHYVCSMIRDDIPELKGELLSLLLSIRDKYKHDKSCNYRVNSLIEQYGLKENVEK